MSEPLVSPGSTARPRRIAVVGCGHVGVVTAAAFAQLGHAVCGVDIDAGLVTRLTSGQIPFREPGLAALVQTNSRQGRLAFTTGYHDALAGAEFIFLCLNTPPTVSGAADLRYVRQAVAQIGAALDPGQPLPLLVVKSTSPIGAGETIAAIFDRAFAGVCPGVVANPEFLREGSAVHDFFHPDRIVVGANRPDEATAVAALYDGIDAPVILTDRHTAELIKYVANAFLATRVSFANEIARLCEELGIDAGAVVAGAALDPRIGSAFFTPGIGYGGSCLPKDVAALCHTGDSAGVTMRLLTAVQEINAGQRTHTVNGIRRALGPLEGRTIAAWGATFKGGTEDLRESPALDVISLLINEGASVRVYDPALLDGPAEVGGVVCASPLEAARGADAVALLTDWPEFRSVDLAAVRAAMAGDLLFDGRSLLDRATVEAAGLVYCGIGR